jgi:hypothetical protein
MHSHTSATCANAVSSLGDMTGVVHQDHGRPSKIGAGDPENEHVERRAEGRRDLVAHRDSSTMQSQHHQPGPVGQVSQSRSESTSSVMAIGKEWEHHSLRLEPADSQARRGHPHPVPQG